LYQQHFRQSSVSQIHGSVYRASMGSRNSTVCANDGVFDAAFPTPQDDYPELVLAVKCLLLAAVVASRVA
jgi:hypothetical protein